MEIFTMAFTLLHLLGAVESVAQGFKRIFELDGVHGPGAFETHSMIQSRIICAGTCVRNGCVSFVYHVGERKCYLYDWPLTISTIGISRSTCPGGSVAFWTTRDVLAIGKQLYHYIPEENKAWTISLEESYTRQQAKNDCADRGGQLLPLKGNSPYDRINELDQAYPGLLKPNNYGVFYVDVMKESGVWKHSDGTTATDLIWLKTQPDGDGVCGVLWHLNYVPHKSFKFADSSCSQQRKHICLFGNV